MKNSHVPLIALAGALAISLAGPAAAETIDREFHQRFDVAVGDRLELHFGDGDVEVTAWEQDALEVDVRYHAELRSLGLSSKERHDFDVEFARQGDVVRVRGVEPSGQFGLGVFTRREHEYRYTVRAPSYLTLDLRGDDGDVRIGGWRSDVTLSSDDGDFHLADSSGDLRLRMEDGDAVIERHAGNLDLRLDDGDVRISDCRGERLSIGVEDGDVEVERCTAALEVTSDDGDLLVTGLTSRRVDARTADGDIVLDVDAPGALELLARTEDGDVDLDLGPGVSARFTIDSGDGRIRVDGAQADWSRERNHASGKIGDGAGSVRVTTQDGRVTLRRVGATPAERM